MYSIYTPEAANFLDLELEQMVKTGFEPLKDHESLISRGIHYHHRMLNDIFFV